VPREAFDPDANYQPEQRRELLSKFLSGLEPTKNPYLRCPEEMKAMGFAGTPYQVNTTCH
jgi:hypothetical protein